MKIGDISAVSRRYSLSDLVSYSHLAGLSHAVPDQIPEPLIGGLFSYLLGVKLPGFGTNYLKQEMEFLVPARADLELTATVEITRIRAEKHLVDLATRCIDETGREICRGRALVLVKDVGVSTGTSETETDAA